MASNRESVAVIGDLVRSKDTTDRVGLHRALEMSLAVVNSQLDFLDELKPTIGDELQGVFREIAPAIRATLLLRLELFRREGIDSRYGIGFGPITILDEETRNTQDGPAWWAARSAIDQVKTMAEEPRTAFLRTRFELPKERVKASLREEAAINAFLFTRDAIVDRMSPRSRRLLLGVLAGRRQAQLAEEEGIYQSAVSQNLAQSGAYSIVTAEVELGIAS
jgi:SatD family protein